MAGNLTNDLPIALPVAQPASRRGERLYPPRSSRVYWHLTCLRREVEQTIQRFVAGRHLSRIIDFGCGNMPYRSLFEPHVVEYIGLDLAGNELADCIMEVPGILPCTSGHADIVLSSQVLEHVHDPVAYLQEAHRVLCDEGLLIISTHGIWRYHPDPTDYWRWTCDGLREAIRQAGFGIVSFKGVMGPEATSLQLWQDAVLHRVPKRIKKSFTRYMQWRIRRADLRCPAHLRDRDACVYVVVARKRGKSQAE